MITPERLMELEGQLQQIQSELQQYLNMPGASDEANQVIRLDQNDAERHIATSRWYLSRMANVMRNNTVS